MSFEKLGLSSPMLRAVRAQGYACPTPIQQQTIPPILEGRDLLGCAQTGTGKTAAFALPTLERLSVAGVPPGKRRPVRALVLTPTRELAIQIDRSFGAYGRFVGLRHAVVYGGVSQAPQERALKRGVDVLTATPGRLLDLMGQRLVRFDRIEVLVLDEADRMLDMGFIPDVRRILEAVPAERQTLLFSATMPPAVKSLADSLLARPVEVRIKPEAPAVETVEHAVYFVEQAHKQALLHHLLEGAVIDRALVFVRTKFGADRIARGLVRAGVAADAIHGNKSQGARQEALGKFKRGKTRVLVASDLAARGLQIDAITHVINFDLPREAETYVHRIGRTGRAGASGAAISFCSFEERSHLGHIERLVRMTLPAVEEHPFRSPLPRSLGKADPYIALPRRRGRRRGQVRRPGR